jgi:hypothetical protein
MQIEYANYDNDTLAMLAVGLRNDAKALQNVNRAEALHLFRLWRKICRELSAREYVAQFAAEQKFRWN